MTVRPGGVISAELDKARQQAASGDYNRAIDSLQVVRRKASTDADEARGLLEVATMLRERGNPRIQRLSAQLVAEAQRALGVDLAEAEMGTTVTAEGQATDAQVYVSTTFEIPGFEIVAFHGPIFGLVVRSRNMFSNLGAGAKALVGGELHGLTRLMVDGRNDALRRLRAAARDKGANAVIGLRYDSSQLGDTGNEVVAYGTAVTVQARTQDDRPSM
jgi:uncharacterized protein YbjQ (UPF0145 family)